jgi:hypothetical protein
VLLLFLYLPGYCALLIFFYDTTAMLQLMLWYGVNVPISSQLTIYHNDNFFFAMCSSLSGNSPCKWYINPEVPKAKA